MLAVAPPIPSAVYTGWRLGGFIHQPQVEPNKTGDLNIFASMAFPPAKTGLRSFT